MYSHSANVKIPDYDQAAGAVLGGLAASAAVAEPLVNAVLASRHCLSKFHCRYVGNHLDPSKRLVGQFKPAPSGLREDLASAVFHEHDLERAQRYILHESGIEWMRPDRELIIIDRSLDRMVNLAHRFRAVGDFDYEVPDKSQVVVASADIVRELNISQSAVAGIFFWPEDWHADWNPSYLDLCSRLRMLIVRVFDGEGFVIASREAENGICGIIDERPRRMEWGERWPELNLDSSVALHSRVRELAGSGR